MSCNVLDNIKIISVKCFILSIFGGLGGKKLNWFKFGVTEWCNNFY